MRVAAMLAALLAAPALAQNNVTVTNSSSVSLPTAQTTHANVTTAPHTNSTSSVVVPVTSKATNESVTANHTTAVVPTSGSAVVPANGTATSRGPTGVPVQPTSIPGQIPGQVPGQTGQSPGTTPTVPATAAGAVFVQNSWVGLGIAVGLTAMLL